MAWVWAWNPHSLGLGWLGAPIWGLGLTLPCPGSLMPPALGLVPSRPLGTLLTGCLLPLLWRGVFTMPLLLRRRQEPKSARRMWPFMSNRILSGLTSLGEAGRVRGLTRACGCGFRHMPVCARMGVGGLGLGKAGGQASWLPGSKKVVTLGKGIHTDNLWRQQGVLWGTQGSDVPM